MTLVVRIVGVAGTGKSHLRRVLGEQLGVATAGIDDARAGHSEDEAWAGLARAIRTTDRIVVESSGWNVRELGLYSRGDRLLTVLCRADRATRAGRLANRQLSPADLTRMLDDQGQPPADVVIDTSRDAALDGAVDRVAGWLG